MSYRCEVCRGKVEHGRARQVHVIKRSKYAGPGMPAGSILREVPVCYGCKALLDGGLSFAELCHRARKLVIQHSAPRPCFKPVPTLLKPGTINGPPQRGP